MTDIDVVIAGAGVIGLAVARELSDAGFSTCVLDPRPRPGMESSTHNSGVIHAGLYYPAGSLKASLCIEGRDRLYAYCESRGVPFRRSGKLVVAASAGERVTLDALAQTALRNGARVSVLNAHETSALEPRIAAHAAIWSPDTGLVDASALVSTLTADLRAGGGIVLTNTAMVGASPLADALEIATERERIRARVLINAAGLHADDVSRMAGGETFRIWPCRGDYAEIVPSRGALVSRPVYPLPDPSGHGLGVHFTPVIGGGILLGPTIRYQESKSDYESDRVSLDSFHASAQLLMPDLPRRDLRDAGSGIRAKLHPATESFADFMIRTDAHQPRLIHAAGIDSPGLTSSLAIGRLTAQLARERL